MSNDVIKQYSRIWYNLYFFLSLPESVMGPTGIPNIFIALSMACKSAPSCTRAVTSTMKGARHRFTKNPTWNIHIERWYKWKLKENDRKDWKNMSHLPHFSFLSLLLSNVRSILSWCTHVPGTSLTSMGVFPCLAPTSIAAAAT